MAEKNNFNKYELFNIKIDVWIDDEEYKEVYEHITPSIEIVDEEFISRFQEFLLEKSPIKSIKTNGSEEEDINGWQPLFWAKYLRARIMENGTDVFAQLLDDLVIYLQRKLPYQSSINEEEKILLQHLYLQELSASGKPGLESLGFALQAENIIKEKNGRQNGGYRFELYRLWAKLNQGIGCYHSKQMMNATKAFDRIIREWKNKWDNNSKLSNEELKWWQSLIYDQAVLFKAEVLEELQFSYHTLTTLTALNSRKKERRLIKEALAYRDMCRLEVAKDKMEKLWDGKFESVDKAFETYKRIKKKNIASQGFGLLIDFYLMKFEEEGSDKSLGNEVSMFIEKLKGYIKDLPEFLKDSKKERMSFYCQIARFLNWLCKKETKQAEDLYHNFSNDIKNITSKDLKKLAKYEYDKYTESLEEFYKEINKDGTKPFPFKDDEIEFLNKVNKFEEEENLLFKFKKMERDLRIERLRKGNRNEDNCSECFQPSPSKDRESFYGILECANKEPSDDNMKEKMLKKMLTDFYDTGMKAMVDRDYEAVMKYENTQFLNHLEFKSKHPGLKEESYHFMGLQRWNSQTPALALSKGGGYFIYKQSEEGEVVLGIAVDPGFDFIDNLFHMGFTLNDIDFILISHAHLDHMRDFEPIISLLLDLKKRGKGKKKIHVMMSLGVYRKLEHVITNSTLREYLADTYIVDINKEIDKDYLYSFKFKKDGEQKFISILDDDESHEIKITPTEAYHDDYSEISDSFGYIVRFRENDKEIISIGYTGDTKWNEREDTNSEKIKWYKKISPQYKDCDVICIHLGALIRSEKGEKFEEYDKTGDKCEDLIESKGKGHLYLFGLLRFLKEIKKQNSKGRLILISEFGEELKGAIRIDLIHRLNQIFRDETQETQENPICLPVDIGLNVMLTKKTKNNLDKAKIEKVRNVWCFGCEDFVKAEDIGYRHFGYGRDEALFYFCKTCLKSKPENVIQETMRKICEFGIPLQKAELKK